MAQYGDYYASAQQPPPYAYPAAPDASAPTYYSVQQTNQSGPYYNPQEYSQSAPVDQYQQQQPPPYAGQDFPSYGNNASTLGYSSQGYDQSGYNYSNNQGYDYGYVQQAHSPASAPVAPPSTYGGQDYGSSYGYGGEGYSSYGYQAQQPQYQSNDWNYQGDGYSQYEQSQVSSSGVGYDPYADQRYDAGNARNTRHEEDRKYASIYDDQKYTVSTKKADSRERSSSARARDNAPSANLGAEKFHVTLIPSDSEEPESVALQINLEGVQVLEEGNGRKIRVYPLDEISKWTLEDQSVLTFWHKPPQQSGTTKALVMASDKVIRSLRDTLTVFCMQLCELRGVSQEVFGSSSSSSDHVNALASKPAGQPSNASQSDSSAGATAAAGAAVDAEDKDVEFWEDPEREGWLMKQGEVIKTWRRRWFVMKQARLFWFKEHRVTQQSRSRGIIRLSDVREVKATEDPKTCTFQLKMKDDSLQYFIADTENEMAVWISEIESKCMALGAIPKAGGNGGRQSGGGRCTNAELAEQLQRSMENMSMNRRS